MFNLGMEVKQILIELFSAPLFVSMSNSILALHFCSTISWSIFLFIAAVKMVWLQENY